MLGRIALVLRRIAMTRWNKLKLMFLAGALSSVLQVDCVPNLLDELVFIPFKSVVICPALGPIGPLLFGC